MGSEALATVEAQAIAVSRDPEAVLVEAQRAARALQGVIAQKPTKVMINREQYLEFEDWQTLGRFYEVTVGSEGDPEFVEIDGAKGFKATAVAWKSGQVISRATAYCMDDEDRWRKAPTYQRASMAQTRASAKALRNVLSWVAVLGGYKPTPAEEMDGLAERQPAKPRMTKETAPPSGTPSCAYCGSVNVQPEKDALGWLRCTDCNKGTNTNRR